MYKIVNKIICRILDNVIAILFKTRTEIISTKKSRPAKNYQCNFKKH